MGILLLRVSVRCDVVRTIIFDRVGLFGLILRVAVVRRLFTLLYGWVFMGVVVIEAGLRAALVSLFLLFFRGIILRRIPLFLVVASFWCIHHIYVVS